MSRGAFDSDAVFSSTQRYGVPLALRRAVPKQPGWVPMYDSPSVFLVRHGSLVCSHFRRPFLTGEALDSFRPQWDVIAEFGELSQLAILDVARIHRVDHVTTSMVGAEIARMGDALRCTALVVRGEGLGARILRTTLAAGTAIAGMSNRTRIFGVIGEALDWVTHVEGQHPSVRDAALDPLIHSLHL